MADQPTFEQIQKVYDRDRLKIKTLREQAEEAAAPILAEICKIEAFQKNREEFLLKGDDIAAFGFITSLFLNGRDDKAAKKKQEADIGVDQKKMEAWLLKMLRKVGKSIATDFGTVYKTRKESVGVADFEAYVKTEVTMPAAAFLVSELEAQIGVSPWSAEDLNDIILGHVRLEAITKAANKTYVLECLGEPNKVDGSRPNAPPSGIDYKAFETVGVRKPGTD